RLACGVQLDWKHLEELLDHRQLDELLSLVTLEEVADAWCSYETRPHDPNVHEDDPDWWAVELVVDRDHYLGPNDLRVRPILALLVDRAPDDDVLGVVGAGPLEDFVKAADEDRLLWIESRAEQSP